MGLKLYKRFQQYCKSQSSTLILDLELSSENDECEIITLRRFGGCMQHYHIHSTTFIQRIQSTLSFTGSTIDKIWPTIRVYGNKNKESHINTTFSLYYITARCILRILAGKNEAYQFISYKGLTSFILLCNENRDYLTRPREPTPDSETANYLCPTLLHHV